MIVMLFHLKCYPMHKLGHFIIKNYVDFNILRVNIQILLDKRLKI